MTYTTTPNQNQDRTGANDQKQNRTGGNSKLTEAELRTAVEQCISYFSPTYLKYLSLMHEFQLKDTRIAKNADSRRLDSLYRTQTGTTVVEYKTQILTQADIIECVYIRGYIELAAKQVSKFKRIYFVAEDVSRAEEYCKTINTSIDIQISCLTYGEYLASHFMQYIKWAKATKADEEITMQHLFTAFYYSPRNWIAMTDFKTILRDFLEETTPPEVIV